MTLSIPTLVLSKNDNNNRITMSEWELNFATHD